MAGFDLGSIIAQAQQLQGGQAQQAQQVADLNNQSAALSEQAGADIRQSGALQAQVESVALQGQLATQKARVQAANAFGTNVNDVSDIITQLGTGMRETAVKLTQAQAQVTDIEANSDIINNPLGWLRDLLQGDGARAQRDALAQDFDTKQKIAAGLNAQTQQTAITQNAITETLSQASITAEAEKTQLLANAEATKQQIAGKQYGAQAIEALRQNGAQEFNRAMQVYGQITEDQRYRESAALRQAQFESIQEQRKKGKLEDVEYADATNRVNTYRTQAGLPPVNETFVRRTLTQGGDLGDDIRRQELQGMKLAGGEMKVFGNTPADTIATLTKDQARLPESYTRASVAVLQQASSAAQAEIAAKLLQPGGEDLKKDVGARAAILNSQVTTVATQLQSNIQSGKGNPYEAPAASVILSEPNGLADTPFGKVVQDLVSTGQNNPSPDMIIAAGVAAVDQGKLSINDVRAGITSYYQNAVGINNATGGYLQLGVPAQRGYSTKLEVFNKSIWDSLGAGLELQGGLNARAIAGDREREKSAAKPLDLTKPTDVTLAITVMQSKKIAADILKRAPK